MKKTSLSTLSPEQFAVVAEAFAGIVEEGLSGDEARKRIGLYGEGDPSVVATLERMLAAHEAEHGKDAFAEAALEAVRLETRAVGDHVERNIPETIGSYRVIRFVASGGMGTVYEAEQNEPRRRVAIKVIRLELLTTASVRRFEAEGHLLGRLRHPGIARVYSMGRMDTPAGPVPYLVLEFIDGVPITEHVKTHRIDRRGRIALLRKVADAVQYAHDNAVLHRDLKPSNILVDRDGNPHVLDFGIGRALDNERSQASLTASGLFLGTLAYMSPEQAMPSEAPIDVRVDVYGLGAVGYELLSGRPPHAVQGLPLHEAVRLVAQHESAPLTSLDSSVDADLSAIFSKALSADHQRRYRSIREFDDDMGRYLAYQPVAARAPSRLYQARKFVRRHRTTCVLLLLILASLVGGLGVSLWQRGVALDAEEAATRVADTATRDHRAALFRGAWSAMETQRYGELSDTLTRLDTDAGARPLELAMLHAHAQGASRVRAIADLPQGANLFLSPRGDQAVGKDPAGRLWHVDLDTARCRLLLAGRAFRSDKLTWGHGERAWFVASTPQRLQIIDGNANRIVRVVSASSARAPLRPEMQDHILWRSAAGVRLVDLNAGALIDDDRVDGMLQEDARLLSGRTLVSLHEGTEWRHLDLQSGDSHRDAFEPRLVRVGRSPDGRFELLGTRRPIVRDREGETWRLNQRTGIGMLDHAFLPNNRIAILYWDGSVEIWDLSRRALVKKLWDPRLGAGERSVRVAIRARPDGGLRSVWRNKVFEWPTQVPSTTLQHAGANEATPYVYALAWHPGGRWLASAAWDGRIVLWDAWRGRAVGDLRIREAMPAEMLRDERGNVVPEFLDWDPDGRRLLVQFPKGGVVVWDVWTRTVERSEIVPAPILALERDSILISDPATGAMREVSRSDATGLRSNGRALLEAEELPLWVHDSRAVGLPARWVGHSRAGDHVVRPSGAMRKAEPAFRVWNLSTSTLWREETNVQSLSTLLVSEGTRLFVGQRDGTILLYDVPGRRKLMTIHAHRDYVSALALSPDSAMLASGSGDGYVKLWPLVSLSERLARRDVARAQDARVAPIVLRAQAKFPNLTACHAACMADPDLRAEDRVAASASLFGAME